LSGGRLHGYGYLYEACAQLLDGNADFSNLRYFAYAAFNPAQGDIVQQLGAGLVRADGVREQRLVRVAIGKWTLEGLEPGLFQQLAPRRQKFSRYQHACCHRK
jgi:hypothetical protein